MAFGIGSADAQRAVPRSPAPQGHHAVPRPIPARPLPGGHYYYRGPYAYRPYYASPYYWYGGFYGGYYSYPFYFSVGVGPYAPYSYGYPFPWYAYDPAASLRLQVTPREAEVFVDGSYAGTVDDFVTGVHTIEIRKEGYRTYTTELAVREGETTTLNVAMTPDK